MTAVSDLPASDYAPVSPGHRALIDRLINSGAPAWFDIAGDEGTALLAALDDYRAPEYLISCCGTVDGAVRVLDIFQALNRMQATPAQDIEVAAVSAVAAMALNQRDSARRYADIALRADPEHGSARLVSIVLEHGLSAEGMRCIAAESRKLYEPAVA
jgi:hypothetical protein